MMVEFDLERFEELPSELRNQDTRELEGTEESDYWGLAAVMGDSGLELLEWVVSVLQ